MAKLTEKERESFNNIISEDMEAIQAKLSSQIKDFWVKAREEILKHKGWDTLIREKEELKAQIEKNNARIHEIETIMNKEQLRPEQVMELGGKNNEYGFFSNASFHGIPVTSQFEYEIVEFIRKHINLNVPAKFIYDLGRSTQRALAMSGTFEEARKAYEEFYTLDFRQYGVDIPPRLQEIKDDMGRLSYTNATLSCAIDKQGDMKAIDSKKDVEKISYLG